MPSVQLEFTKFSTLVNPDNTIQQSVWIYPENAQINDGNVAFSQIGSQIQSETGSILTQILSCSTLANNSIPANATITGIEIEIKRLNNRDATQAVQNVPVGKSYQSQVLDSVIRLFDNNTKQFIGGNYFNLHQTWKESSSNFGNNFETVIYGGPTDTWGIDSNLLNTSYLLSGIGFSLVAIYSWQLVDLGGQN